ncbi:MAG: hypothetical protein MAGBODY4_01328 [Candidatus Marinimicrobia bacterium]|nr:hypothetical protein [Candidatus Neomarinimicrobiota bacterium]
MFTRTGQAISGKDTLQQIIWLGIGFVLLNTSTIFSQQISWPDTLPKPNPKEVGALDPWPGIEQYPAVIQEYDAKFREFYQWYQEELEQRKTREARSEIRIPESMLLPLARLYISIDLYHEKLDKTGYADRYKFGRWGNGFLFHQMLDRLSGKWRVIVRSDGLVLGNVIKDTLLARNLNTPVIRDLDKMVYFKINSDIWGSIPEDTILIRYHSEWFPNGKIQQGKDILTQVHDGSHAALGEKRIEVYNAEFLNETIPQFLVVENGVIQDPNKVLNQKRYTPLPDKMVWQENIVGKSYQEYEKDWENFLEENGISP